MKEKKPIEVKEEKNKREQLLTQQKNKPIKKHMMLTICRVENPVNKNQSHQPWPLIYGEPNNHFQLEQTGNYFFSAKPSG